MSYRGGQSHGGSGRNTHGSSGYQGKKQNARGAGGRQATVEIQNRDVNWDYHTFQRAINKCFQTTWIHCSPVTREHPTVSIAVAENVANQFAKAINNDRSNRMRAAVVRSQNQGSGGAQGGLEATLNEFVASRYQSKYLDLDGLINLVPNFSFTPHNVKILTRVIIPCADAEIVNLANNKLTSLKVLTPFFESLSSLHSLALSGNALPSPSRLMNLSPLKTQLKHLMVGGNPFLAKIEPTDLLKQLSIIFPCLETVDNVKLSPPMLFNLPEKLLLPPVLPQPRGCYVTQSNDPAVNDSINMSVMMFECFLRVVDGQAAQPNQHNSPYNIGAFFCAQSTFNLTVLEDAPMMNPWLSVMFKTPHINNSSANRTQHTYKDAEVPKAFSHTFPSRHHDISSMTTTVLPTRIVPNGVFINAKVNVLDKSQYIRNVNISALFSGQIVSLTYAVSGGDKFEDDPEMFVHPPIDEVGRIREDPQQQQQGQYGAGMGAGVGVAGATQYPTIEPHNIPQHIQQAVLPMPYSGDQKLIIAQVMAHSGCDVNTALQALTQTAGDVNAAINQIRR